MDNSVLDMPDGKRPSGKPSRGKAPSSGKIAAAAIILVLIGLALWKFLPGDEARQTGDEALRRPDGVAESVSGREGSAAGSAPSSAGERLPITEMGPDDPAVAPPVGPAVNGSGSDNVVQPPAGVAPLPIQTSPLPGSEEEGEDEPDEVDRALAGETSSSSSRLTPDQRAGLPSVASSLSEAAVPDDAGRGSDSVVTPDFVRNLARWLVDCYQPGGRSARGRTTATLMAANMRYGSGLTGLRHAGGDPARGRAAVLNYVYSPGMLDALYRLYVDRFLNEIADAAAMRKPPLDGDRMVDMLTLYAGRFQEIGAALRGVAALPDLRVRVEAVRRAGREVTRCNGVFADVLFAYDQAREAGRAQDADALRGRMMEASHAVQRAMDNRAAARRVLADAVRRSAGGRVPGEDTLVYLAEWVDRRGDGSGAATRMASDLFFRLSERFDAQAREWADRPETVRQP